MSTVETDLRLSGLALLINALLAGVKIAAGVLGNSYVLIVDGIESTVDTSSRRQWSLHHKIKAVRYSTPP